MGREEIKLAARREELLKRSEELRSRIVYDVSSMSSHLRVVDKASAVLRSGGGRALIVGGLVLLMVTGPGRVLKVAGRAALMWSVARRWLPRALTLMRGLR
jgi:hypothetical protein